MDKRNRFSLKFRRKSDIPSAPGVYAFYRGKERIYIGKASILSNRIWKNRCGRGAAMTGSALRRNIAKYLTISTAADIKSGRYQPNADEVEAIRLWLDGCDVTWLECESPLAPEQLEAAFKAEHVPTLTKR